MKFRPFAVLANHGAPPSPPIAVSADSEVDAAIARTLTLPTTLDELDHAGLLALRSECEANRRLLVDRLKIARRRCAMGVSRLPASRLTDMEDAVRRFSDVTQAIQAEHAARKDIQKEKKRDDHVLLLEADRESLKNRFVLLAAELADLQAKLGTVQSREAVFAMAFVEEAKVILAEQTFGKIGERARERMRRKPTDTSTEPTKETNG